MSKYDQYRNKSEVFPHKHCTVCNKMIPEDDNEFDTYCSLECSGYTSSQKKNKKKKNWIMFGSYGVMIIVFIVIMIIQQLKAN